MREKIGNCGVHQSKKDYTEITKDLIVRGRRGKGRGGVEMFLFNIFALSAVTAGGLHNRRSACCLQVPNDFSGFS